MRTLFLILLLLSALAHSPIYASNDEHVLGDAVRDVVPNMEVLADGIIGGGAPDLKALETIQENGFKTVIDLRTPGEGIAEEEQKVQELGMTYINIPMSSREASDEQVAKLASVLTEDAYPVLMHCRSGGRVDALWSEYQKTSRD